jgi:XTP/dITP diphosphohydrolase
MTGFLVMSDDSGFEVDKLNKEPGIYSARYMGEDTSYDIKNAEILRRMEGVPWEDRTARFVCAIAMVGEDGREEVAEATFEGFCAYEIKGEYGFGYDPIFFVPEYGCNDAELLPEVKNSISHRAKALRMARDILADKFA